MAVTLTSPVLGKAVGESYTGPLEDWLLAEGYAKRTGYTGPGVSNSGATDVVPAKDPQLPQNRTDKAQWPLTEVKYAGMANDKDNLTKTTFPNKGFDYDAGGVDDDAPTDVKLAPVTGPAAGGTVVTITGDNLARVSSVTFGGTAGTALNVTKAADGEIKVTTPARAAGAVNVVLVDPSGNTTVTNGFTFTA